jgi:hypothetical protein
MGGVPRVCSSPAATEDLRRCQEVLDAVWRADEQAMFHLPLHPSQFEDGMEHYSAVIATPMDLTTAARLLAVGGVPESFARNVRVMFSNCEAYNRQFCPRGGSRCACFACVGVRLATLFEDEWAERFPPRTPTASRGHAGACATSPPHASTSTQTAAPVRTPPRRRPCLFAGYGIERGHRVVVQLLEEPLLIYGFVQAFEEEGGQDVLCFDPRNALAFEMRSSGFPCVAGSFSEGAYMVPWKRPFPLRVRSGVAPDGDQGLPPVALVWNACSSLEVMEHMAARAPSAAEKLFF